MDELVEFKIAGRWMLPRQSGYSPGFAKGYITTEAAGGLPRIRRNYRNQPVPVSATYEFKDESEIQAFYQFYYGAIASGSKKFKAMLDFSGELLEYVCQLQDDGISVSEWRGFYASVTLNMWCVLDIDEELLAAQYIVSSILSHEDYQYFIENLPDATDPLAYTYWTDMLPYSETDYADPDYTTTVY